LERREDVISTRVGKYPVRTGIDSNILAVAAELERSGDGVKVVECARGSPENSESSKKESKKGAGAR